jgi:hypothetical protein
MTDTPTRTEYDDLRQRVGRLETQRDELLRLRDAHGARLGAIEARLAEIERTTDGTHDMLTRWSGETDRTLAALAAAVARIENQ